MGDEEVQDQSSLRDSSQFLTPEDEKAWDALFKNRAGSRSIFDKHIPKLTQALISANTDYETGHDFLVGLGRLNIAGSSDRLLPRITSVIRSFSQQRLSFDESTMSVLLHSILDNIDNLTNTESYIDKLSRTCAAYARSRQIEMQLPDPGDRDIAVALSEGEAVWLGSRIIQSIQAVGESLAVSPRTGIVQTTDSNAGNREVYTEFFGGKNGTEYVRVGNLFFVDTKYRNIFPPEVVRFFRSNIIFVNGMDRSELSDRLGYFTANTITSLMSLAQEDVVIDCGSGGGLLSLAAKRLGVKAVLAVDFDRELIAKANTNFKENGYGDDPWIKAVQADLRDTNSVLNGLGAVSEGGRVIILTNIGSWGSYPITNVTSYALIEAIEYISSPWFVKQVISGGYSSQPAKEVPREDDFLRGRGIDRKSLPVDNREFDKAVLHQLGFIPVVDAESEALENAGSFTRTARSMVMAKDPQ